MLTTNGNQSRGPGPVTAWKIIKTEQNGGGILRVLASLMSAWHTLKSSEKRDPQLRKCLGEAPAVDMRVGHPLNLRLTGRAQAIVSGTILGLAILGPIRKQAEQAHKQHPSIASASAPASKLLPCFFSCSDFLQGWSAIWKYSLSKPLLVTDSHHSNRNLNSDNDRTSLEECSWFLLLFLSLTFWNKVSCFTDWSQVANSWRWMTLWPSCL